MLVVFRGLPGTGKTHLVRRLSRARSGFLVLSRDSIRSGLIARPTYAPEEKALVDDMIITMAGFLLDRGRDVVIDGMALSSAGRVEQFARVAESRGVPLLIVECTCSEATALERLRHDRGGHPAGDRGESLYFEVKTRWEPLARPFLGVDTEGDAARPLAAIIANVERITSA
jgi:predicted kinase